MNRDQLTALNKISNVNQLDRLKLGMVIKDYTYLTALPDKFEERKILIIKKHVRINSKQLLRKVIQYLNTVNCTVHINHITVQKNPKLFSYSPNGRIVCNKYSLEEFYYLTPSLYKMLVGIYTPEELKDKIIKLIKIIDTL